MPSCDLLCRNMRFRVFIDMLTIKNTAVDDCCTVRRYEDKFCIKSEILELCHSILVLFTI